MPLISILKFIRLMGLVTLLGMMTTLPASSATILTFVESYYPCCGIGVIDGLDAAGAVIVTPDNKHVYVIGHNDNAVALFSRNATTGALSFVAVYRDGIDNVDGLDGATSITSSPDGAYLYVASDEEDAIVIFHRDSTTGELTFVEVQKDGQNNVDGLNGVQDLTISPDGQHLYAVSSGAVAVFSRNLTTGTLTFIQVQREGESGVDGLSGATDVTVSPDGEHLYVVASVDAAVVVFSRNPTTGRLIFVEVQKNGQNGVTGLKRAKAVSVSPDGKHLYVASTLPGLSPNHAVTIFSRDETTGALTFIDVLKNFNGLFGARSVTLSPNGQHLYVAASSEDALTLFSRDGATGQLTLVEVYKNEQDSLPGLDSPQQVSVSPDGKHLYVTGTGGDAVVVFERNASTGALSFVQEKTDEVKGPDALTVSPDGRHVYTVTDATETLVVFARHPTTGALTFVEFYKDGQDGVEGLHSAQDVTISPNGQHLYAIGFDTVAVFRRDPTTGKLTFLEFHDDGRNGVDGLRSAQDVTVSPDGEHLYVASSTDDAVAVFSREPTTGALTFVEFHKDGQDGVEGLDDATDLSVSLDGKNLYAAGARDDAVVVFEREPATGKLTFVEVHQDGQDGVDGLNGVVSIVTSPDGQFLYAASYSDQAVVAFSRDPTTGQLTFAEVYRDGYDDVEGLDGANAIASSKDGRHLYVAGRQDDAIAIFRQSMTRWSTYLPLVLKAPPTGALQFSNATGNPVTVTLVGYATQTFPATIGPHVWSGIPPATYEWEATGTCDGNTGTVGSTQPPSSPDYREPVMIIANQTIPLNQERGGQFSCE